MGVRTIRLDADAEAALARVCKNTGLSMSEVFKRGLKTYEEVSQREQTPSAWELYQKIDLGEGGWAKAPARDAKAAVHEALRRKHKR